MLISSKTIIDKVFRNYKVADSLWIGDAVEWIGEAIGLIGRHVGYDTRISCEFEVENHTACFPEDIVALIGVCYNGRRLPLGGDQSGYGIIDGNALVNTKSTTVDPDQQQVDALLVLYDKLIIDLAAAPADPPDIKIQLQTAIDTVLKKLTKTTPYLGIGYNSEAYEYYEPHLDHIKTSFQEGDIRYVYTAFYVDENGMPMVYNHPEYINALLWYIVTMLTQRGYDFGVISYAIASANWDRYCYSAKTKCKIPSIDKMELFYRSMTKLKFDNSLYDRFFIGAENRDYTIR